MINNDLIFRPPGIGRQASCCDDFHAVFRPNVQLARTAPPTDSINHRILILQRHIQMAGRCTLEARNLPPDPDMRIGVFHRALKRLGQFGNREFLDIAHHSDPRMPRTAQRLNHLFKRNLYTLKWSFFYLLNFNINNTTFTCYYYSILLHDISTFSSRYLSLQSKGRG